MSRMLNVVGIGKEHDTIVAVPWAMIEPHEAQVRKNHGKTLEEIDAAGGLDIIELLAALDDRPYPVFPTLEQVTEAVQFAIKEVSRRVREFTGAQSSCALETVAVAAVVWVCAVCSTEQVTRSVLPERIPCNFCRAVHLVKPTAPDKA